MKPGTACLSLVILTEDSGKDGRATVEALARRMLQLVVPDHGSHRIELVPRDPGEEEAMRGNVWKADGKNPLERERRLRLLRYIARKLLQTDTFVLFHIDGDRPWRQRHTSENLEKFERLIRASLPQVVDRGRAHNPRPVSRDRVDATSARQLPLEHLILLSPFRSIEAWLFQNLSTGIEICQREHQGAHVADLQTWQAQREQLDELPAPEAVFCLGKAFNLELARRFPAADVYDVRKSFAETVDRLLACDALCRALERTRN